MGELRRIFVFSQNYPPSSLADAVRIGPIVSYLLAKNIQVELCTQTEAVDQKNTAGLNVHSLFSPAPKNSDRIILRLTKELGLGIEIFFRILFSRRCEFYLLTSPPFMSCAVGSWALWFKTGKLICDIRDIYPDIYVKQDLIKELGFSHRCLSWVERELYRKSYKILAATEGLRNLISQRTKSEVQILRNGFPEAFTPLLDKYSEFGVVFHGNLGRFQNIELLLEVASVLETKLPDVKCVIIGSGPKAELVRNSNLSNLSYLGRLSNEETARIIQKCHIGISLRDDSQISIDSVPVKLYEYIGVGIPSIVTPISEGGILLEDNKLGFNLPNDLNVIVEKIEMLFHDQDYYRELCANVLSIRDQFSRQVIVQKVFDSIL